MTPPEDPGFVADVKRAASVWSGSPGVPLVYLMLGLAYAALVLLEPSPPTDCVEKTMGSCPADPDSAGSSAALFFALIPVMLFQIGLSGTARVWYARCFVDGEFASSEIWSLSWRFFGRFFVLGLLFFAVTIPFASMGAALAALTNSQLPLVLGGALALVTADVMFTFATAVLALYSTSAWAAFTGGLSILRSNWPACALYALVPPMALQLFAQGSPSALGRPLTAVLALCSPLLTLLFAGAAAAFVLRRWPPLGPDGSLASSNHWTAPLNLEPRPPGPY